MTLRDFTKDCQKNCKMPFENIEWRRTAQFQQKFTYTFWLWGKKYGALQQLWEGVHSSAVVIREWRDVDEYYNYEED